MGWFFKKGKEQEDLVGDDNGFTLPLDDIDLSVLDNADKPNNDSRPKPRHALTPDEVLGKDKQKPQQVFETSQIPMAGGKTVEVNSATVLLYKRMMESKAAAETKENEQDKKPLTKPDAYVIKPNPSVSDTEVSEPIVPDNTKVIMPKVKKDTAPKHLAEPKDKKPVEKVTEKVTLDEPEQLEMAFDLPEVVADLKIAEQPKAEEKPTQRPKAEEKPKVEEQPKEENISEQPKAQEITETEKKEDTPSLLSRCMPYIIDDNGHDHSEDFPPAYTLESVEDIISAFENKAAQKVSEMYGTPTTTPAPAPIKTENAPTQNKAKSFKVKPLQRRARPAKLEDTAPRTAPSDITVTKSGVYSDPTENENSIKTYQASFSTIEIPATAINSGSDNATITFDINDIRRATGDDLGDTKQIVISDIGEEKESIEKFIAPKSADFDEIIDDLNGYTCYDDAKRIRVDLYKTKRHNLLKLLLTAIITLAITVLRFPFFEDALFGKADTVSAISLIALAVLSLVNFKTVISVKDILKGCKNPNIPVSLSVICVMLHLGITLLFLDTAVALNLAPVAALALCFTTLCDFLRSAEIIDNFRYVATPHQKNAVDIIKDQEVSGKIISTGIEGRPYIIAPRKTVNLLGFLKASNAPSAIASKIPLFTIVTVAAALVIGIAAIFTDNISVASSAFTLTVCIGCSPITQLIGALPTKNVSSRLSDNNAMLCGYESAMSIEPANCVVLNAADLFPSGTIELINMKILGKNSLDKTFLDAAAITLSAQSPLYNVFKEIAESSDATLPYCDSVKYEDRMGVSGWVNDRHIFIGNRTLLEAHSIAVPDIEVDKKILKKGYFPVYVACNGKAYALLMVRYIPKKSIKQQLVKLASMGVTFYLNSTDPNINTVMVTDYFELFDDSVYSLKSDQIKSFKDATNYKDSCFAPACFRGNISGLLAIIAESIKLKVCVNVMTALNIMCCILGIFTLCFSIFTGNFSLLNVTVIILWQLVSAIIGSFALFIK